VCDCYSVRETVYECYIQKKSFTKCHRKLRRNFSSISVLSRATTYQMVSTFKTTGSLSEKEQNEVQHAVEEAPGNIRILRFLQHGICIPWPSAL
jgi:hypothetical protein